MAKHDSIPVSSGKLPLFAPFAVPKIGNMATAWHEILHDIDRIIHRIDSVSYTHLTLPTIA